MPLKMEDFHYVETHTQLRIRIETTVQLKNASLYSIWRSWFDKHRPGSFDSCRRWLYRLRTRVSKPSERRAEGGLPDFFKIDVVPFHIIFLSLSLCLPGYQFQFSWELTLLYPVSRAHETSPMGQNTRIDPPRWIHPLRESRNLQIPRKEVLLSSSPPGLRHRSCGAVRPGAVRRNILLRRACR